jgi:FkbM family methyltransferase
MIYCSSHIVNDSLVEGNTIIDAGAAKGEFIEFLRSKGINSKVIAIEPSKSNLEVLSNKGLENIEILPLALVGAKKRQSNLPS